MIKCLHCGAETSNGLALCDLCRRAAGRERMDEAAGCDNTPRPLARSTSTRPKEGLAMKATRIDLTGKRFGRLDVLRYVGGKGCRWTCRCECGTVKDISGGSLRRGSTTSCGCLRSEVTGERFRLSGLAGQRFGRLVVSGFAGTRGGESFWRCWCDCGSMTEVRGWMLRNGSTQSCGCLHREAIRANRTDDPTYGAVHTRLRVSRGSASGHPCADCGAPAEQWSYDHKDPDALVSDAGHPYSLDFAHYVPRCCSCHRTYDAAHGGVSK